MRDFKAVTGDTVRVTSYDLLTDEDATLIRDGIVGSELEVVDHGEFNAESGYVVVIFNGEQTAVFDEEIEKVN